MARSPSRARRSRSTPRPASGGIRLDRPVSAPLVLTLASAMVSVGVAGAYYGLRDRPTDQKRATVESRRAASTPERAISSYFEAFVSEEFDTALALSRGPAADVVLRRMAASVQDGILDEATEREWRALGRAKTELLFDESHDQPDGSILVHATLRGDVREQPYRRRLQFLVAPDSGRWFVKRMTPGARLTPRPDFGWD